MSSGEVAAAVERGALAAALDQALAWWRAGRHPRVASLIEQLSERVGRNRSRPAGKSARQHAAWLALAAKGDPGDLDGLLATLTERRSARPLVERITALAGREDPRIAKALLALLHHPPLSGPLMVVVSQAIFDRLTEIADPRSADAMVGFPALEARLRAPFVPLSADDERALAAIEQRLGERDPAALYAAVYAAPDDDVPRSVLADLLHERGDPRGELISLQLARSASGGEPGPRERALLRAHAREWLGAIAPAVSTKNLGFERGFVARCEAIGSALADRPEWATVTSVDVRGWRGPLAPLLASMPALHTLRGLARASLACSHPRVRMLGVEVLDEAGALLAAELPALRVLEAWKAWCPFAELAALWSSARFASLERFVVDTNEPEDWIPGLATLAGPHVVFTNRIGGPWQLRFAGDRVIAGDVRTDATVTRDQAIRLAELLALVPSPGTRRLELAPGLPACAELAAVTAQFASVRHEELA